MDRKTELLYQLNDIADELMGLGEVTQIRISSIDNEFSLKFREED